MRITDKNGGQIFEEGDPTSGILTADLEEQQQLVFVYDQFDLQDKCPLFDLRIAVSSATSVKEENLRCEAYELPPQKLTVKDPTHVFEGFYAMSSDYIEETGKDGLVYDIILNIQSLNSYLDIQLRTDFLTFPLKFKLL